jgi:pimeloyl-ACP methyl ester carboxylesterase
MVPVLLFVFVVCILLCLIKRDIPVEKLLSLYTDQNSCFFHWKGMTVHYKDEGHNTPIVLLHGTSSSLHTWDALTHHLKNQYRIIRMDLPGYGITGPHPEKDYSMAMYVQLIHDLMAQLGIDRFMIGGNSWGGMLAWHYALVHTRQITGLILIDAAGYKMKLVPKRFKLLQHGIGRLLLRHTLPTWMVKAGLSEVVHNHQIISKAMIRRYAYLTRRSGNRQAFIDHWFLREHPDPSQLSTISIPALLLWGEYDKLYPVKQLYTFSKLLPRSLVVAIKNAGHLPMEEDPEACATHIRKFVHDASASTLRPHRINTTK